MAALRAALVAASLASVLAPAVASADPEPFCRLDWDKPVVHYGEDGLPEHVEVDRPQWIC